MYVSEFLEQFHTDIVQNSEIISLGQLFSVSLVHRNISISLFFSCPLLVRVSSTSRGQYTLLLTEHFYLQIDEYQEKFRIIPSQH